MPPPQASGDSSAPALALDAAEPAWQNEVRQRLERYRERRRLRGGAEQQNLDFQPAPRRRRPDNVIVFQKTPAAPLADPVLLEDEPQRKLDPCTTLFPVAAEAAAAKPAPAPVHRPLLAADAPDSPPPSASALPAAAESPVSSAPPLSPAMPSDPPAPPPALSPPPEFAAPCAVAPEPLADAFPRSVLEPQRLPPSAYWSPAPAALEISVRPLPPALAAARILPRPAASPRLRLLAGLLDLAAVAGLTLLFALSASLLLGFPHPRHAAGWMLLLPFPAFWGALYLLLSFYYCGATPGMRALRLEVLDFQGHRCAAAQLRARAWFSLLALAALGVSFFWAYLDEEKLSWHDHLSQSFIARL